LKTNSKVEAEKSLEKLEETLNLISDDIYEWKWAIIILVNCIQSFMVLELEGVDQLNVIKDYTKDKRHIQNHLSADKGTFEFVFNQYLSDILNL